MGAPKISATVQSLDELEGLDSAGGLPAAMQGDLANLRMLRDNNALDDAQAPGTGAGMSVEPPNFSPVAVPPPPAALPPAAPESPEGAFVQAPAPPAIGPGVEAGGALGGILGEQARVDEAALRRAAATQNPDQRARANAEGLIDVMLYRGLRLPEQQINALMSKYGLKDETPQQFKERMMREGKAGANLLPTKTPSGFLETLGALTAPTDAFNVVPFGLGVFGQYSTGSEAMGDAVQGIASVVPLTVAGVKGVKALKPFTYNERRYRTELGIVRENQRYVELNQDIAAQVRADNAAIVQRAREAQARAEVAATQSTRAAQAQQSAAFAERDAARQALPSTGDAMRQRLAIQPDAPTPEEAGQMLRAVDRSATATGTGANVAVKGIRADLNTMYEGARRISDTANNGGPVRVPLESAQLTSLRQRAVQSLSRQITRHGTSAEEDLALRIQHLGLQGIQNGAGEYMPLDADGGNFRRLVDTLHNDPTFQPVYDAPTYREISTLHAEAANAALSPREYGISGNTAAREFYRLVQGELKDLKLSLEMSNPTLHEAATAADVFRGRRVMPMIAAAKAVKGAETDYGAFRKVVSGTGAREDPTHMVTLFSQMDQNERAAYQTAALDNLIRDHTAADGRVDFNGVLNDWHGAHPWWRRYMASDANAGVQQVMNDWVVAQRRLERADEAVAAASAAQNPLRVAAREARAEERRARVGLRNFTRDETRALHAADRDVREALHGLREAQNAANRAGRRPVGASERILSPNSEGKWEIAAAHTAGGIIMGATGHPVLAVSQLGIAMAVMHRPKLVAAAARMTNADPNAPAVAGALYAVIRAYESMSDPNAVAPFEGVPTVGGALPPPGIPGE